MINPGDRIGPYRVQRLLGRGGMGTVYQAHQSSLSRDVALKLIRPELLAHPEHGERFRREMQALGRLSHPHVVKVYESGEHDGLAWFAMELLPGRSLGELLLPAQPLPLPRVRTVCEGLFSAVAYLHEQGLLHRDIKPSNVQVPEHGGVKLMDFGLVKDVTGTLVTEEGTALGTPRYMAPEVILGRGASVASDLYQLGVVVYQMLTGLLPVDAATLPELLQVLERGRITRLREHRPDLPESMERIVHALLLARPDARPRSAAAVWKELAGAFDEALLTTALPAAPLPDAAGRHSGPGAKISRVPDPSKRSAGSRSLAEPGARGALVAVTVGACIGLVTVAALWKPRRADAPGTGTSGAGATATPAARPVPVFAGLPADRFPPTAVPGGFTFAAETLPGRRVTAPRGVAADARGRVFVGSAEGLAWLDGASWRSRALVPEPAALAVLCADRDEGVWLRVRFTAATGTDTWLVRADERGVRERLPVPESFGRPSVACLADNGDVLVATSGAPFRRDRASGALVPLPMPGVEGLVLGFFAGGGRTGAWTATRVYERDGAAWVPLDLRVPPPGAIRGVARVGGRLWICGSQGALGIAPDGRAPVRVLSDRILTSAFDSGAPDHVLLLGPGGIYRQPVSGAAALRLDVPGVTQAGVNMAGAGVPGEVWALATTPVVFSRVTRDAVVVDELPAGDPAGLAAERAAARALWSTPGMCIPYAWIDSGDTLAAGRRGTLLRLPLEGGTPSTLVPLSDSVWPMDLWLAAPGGPLFMIWQREGTSNRYLDRIDPSTGDRRRAEGLPELMDGPVRVSPDATIVYQGPFIPIVQLLESGIYVRFHGERPLIDDVRGLRAPALKFWDVPRKTAGQLELPADYAGGPLTFDPAASQVVYAARDGQVLRRVLSARGPGAPTRIVFPPGADERTVAELELSPDGRLLAYVLQPRASGRSSLHLLDLVTHEGRLLSSWLYDYAQPRWSPDGRRLAFVRRGVDQTDAELAARTVRR